MKISKREAKRVFRDVTEHPDGVVGVMCDDQVRMGRTIVPTGSVTPFAVPREDWRETVISVAGKVAFLVLVEARTKRQGALRRLVAAVKDAGMCPVICEPIGLEMPAVLSHWSWVRFQNTHHWIPKEFADG